MLRVVGTLTGSEWPAVTITSQHTHRRDPGLDRVLLHSLLVLCGHGVGLGTSLFYASFFHPLGNRMMLKLGP